jgi:hypothetical protein
MRILLIAICTITTFNIKSQLEFEKELDIINKSWNQKEVFYVKSTYKFWNEGNKTINTFNQCNSKCTHEACFSKDCKCTEVIAPKQPIRPGAEGSFTIIYKVDPSKSSDQTNVNQLKRGVYHKIVEIGIGGNDWYEIELKGKVNLSN